MTLRACARRLVLRHVLVTPEAEVTRAGDRLEGNALMARGAAARHMRLRRRMCGDRGHEVTGGAVALCRVVILVATLAVQIRRRRERDALRVTARAVDVIVALVREREIGRAHV